VKGLKEEENSALKTDGLEKSSYGGQIVQGEIKRDFIEKQKHTRQVYSSKGKRERERKQDVVKVGEKR